MSSGARARVQAERADHLGVLLPVLRGREAHALPPRDPPRHQARERVRHAQRQAEARRPGDACER